MTRKSEGIYFHTYGKIINNKKQNEFSYNKKVILFFLYTLTSTSFIKNYVYASIV